MHCRQIDIDIPTALRALAAEEHLAFIDSCGHGGSILTWGVKPRIITQLEQLTVKNGDAQMALPPAWPES
ncbi:MAG: hypothetical protein HRU15_10270, partial [Planctomycetes bacterium]|nr:hypothetical protein [Planctomycetota bacterium]